MHLDKTHLFATVQAIVQDRGRDIDNAMHLDKKHLFETVQAIVQDRGTIF